jgi:hypothetical protein
MAIAVATSGAVSITIASKSFRFVLVAAHADAGVVEPAGVWLGVGWVAPTPAAGVGPLTITSEQE